MAEVAAYRHTGFIRVPGGSWWFLVVPGIIISMISCIILYLHVLPDAGQSPHSCLTIYSIYSDLLLLSPSTFSARVSVFIGHHFVTISIYPMSHPHARQLIRLEPQVRTYQPTTNFQGIDHRTSFYILLLDIIGQCESNLFVVTCCIL